MQSSGILGCVALVRNDVSEDRVASIVRVSIISELRTILAVASYCYGCSQLTDSCHPDDGGNTFLRNVEECGAAFPLNFSWLSLLDMAGSISLFTFVHILYLRADFPSYLYFSKTHAFTNTYTHTHTYIYIHKINPVVFSPLAKYTDRATGEATVDF
jgi:hypothetical protein